MSVSAATMGSVSDLLQMIESNEPEKWQEIKHLIYEQYHEVKESWLVHLLYDLYAQSGSSRCLELLLNVREPHDKFLLDTIAEGIRNNQGKSRLTALSMLGFVVRKQPSWLYRMTQHALMKELLKLLKHEEDLVLMMSALMDLLVLMPIVPVYIAPYLQELFEIFSRVAAWRFQSLKGLPEVQQAHVQVGLYAFFHRLYGMFPCNFLSYLRVHYSESNRENYAVFTHTIKPMLNTVKMHPMLVTQTRDFEKTASRWKRMELHDIIIESSRYSLDSYEGCKEEEIFQGSTDFENLTLKSQSYTGGELNSIMDPYWTPSRKCELNSPTSVVSDQSSSLHIKMAVVNLESPPEAAIEATPETTPFVTPVKDEMFRFARPQPSSAVSRQLNLDAKMKSPGSVSTTSSALSPTMSKEPSPFRFPDNSSHAQVERRDSIFCGPDLSKLSIKPSPVTPITPALNQVEMITPNTLTPSQANDSHNCASVAISTSGLLGSSKTKQNTRVTTPSQLQEIAFNIRPSPVKFTNQRPEQFPIRPEPERMSQAVAEGMRHKMLSLEKLKDLPHFEGGNDDDDEVTEITGGNDDPGHHILTRHITPRLMDSGDTSRTMSSSSTTDKLAGSPSITLTAPFDHQHKHDFSGGLQPPSKASVKEFVRVAKRRIKYISVCGSGGVMPTDIASEVASAMNKSASPLAMLKLRQKSTLKRTTSCPDIHKIHEIVASKNTNTCSTSEHQPLKHDSNNMDVLDESAGDENEATLLEDGKVTNASVQTEEFLVSPYEHLFPFVLPQWLSHGDHQSKNATTLKKAICEDNPYDALDHYVEAAYKSITHETLTPEQEIKKLKNEVALLHNQLLYERHRREVLGMRNRSLLGKTKHDRILEEQKNSLKDQLLIASSEMAVLSDQLDQLRSEKHQAEVEHVLKERERDIHLEALSREKAELNQAKVELVEKTEKQSLELKNALSEITKLQAALFNAKAEVDRLEKKEDIRRATENQLIETRKEVLLLGELVRKYREKLDKPMATEKEHLNLYKEAARQQIDAMKGELSLKSSEAEALKARNNELENIVMQHEDSMTAVKSQVKTICDEYEEQLKTVETSYDSLIQSQIQFEIRLMELKCENEELKHQLGVPRRGTKNQAMAMAYPGKSKGSLAPAIRSGAGGKKLTSANVDIEFPAAVLVGTGGITDKSFMVGSPPSSSGESLGSDQSEIIRRALELGGVIPPNDVLSGDENQSPEIGSAVSAREAFAAASSSSNGGTK